MADSKRVRISKREGALMARLAAKEQEVYEVQTSARDLYRARRPVTDFARQVYTDPAINVEFQLLTAQLAEMENSLRLKEAELKELRATADKTDQDKGAGRAAKGADATAKALPSGGGNPQGGAGAASKVEGTAARASALVARCQRLEQENEELAASADVAKVSQLTSEKAVAEAYAGELKTALEKAYEYIEQLEEEREVNSNKVYGLEEELRSMVSRQQQRQQFDQQQQQQQPSWSGEGDAHHDQQEPRQNHYGQQEQHQQHQQQEGGEGQQHQHQQQQQVQGGGEGGYGESPSPPPPEAEPDATAAEDDLYGDMDDSTGGAFSGEGGDAEGTAVKDDPMQQDGDGDGGGRQEEEQRREGEHEDDAPPAAARTSTPTSRPTRRATRSRT